MTTPAPRKNASRACVNCRKRKIKCILGNSLPCVHCQTLNLQCVIHSTDKRKDRYRNEYLASLEAKVARYEAVIRSLTANIKSSVQSIESLGDDFYGSHSVTMDTPISTTTADETSASRAITEPPTISVTHSFLSPGPERDMPLPTNVEGRLSSNNFKNDRNYSVSVYGPTSIFNTESIPSSEIDAQSGNLHTDATIVQCIKLFFRWQYPDMHLFVFREAFLLDFFNPESSGVYAAKELVYAICAIGSLMSESDELSSLSPQFHKLSLDSLTTKLDSPSICSLQAYLLLGLYEVYNGRNNSGWMLTGDGLRMGFGIGFHLSPENWLVGKHEEISPITISVRSRIFWGSFMADRFLGLILGRLSFLKMDESSIPESFNMPAIETIDEYTYPGTSDYERASYIDVSNPLKSIIKLVEISDAMLHELFSKASDGNMQRKLELLERYNNKIVDWRQKLPSIVQWDLTTLTNHGHDHTKMFMRYFYYIVLLCLNRPFVEVSNTTGRRDTTNALKICETAIDDIHLAILSYVKHHGFRRCSMLIVYSCIICISITLLATKGGDMSRNPRFEEYFFDFMTLLKLSSLTWKLSEKSYLKVRLTFQAEYKCNYETELSHFLQRKQKENSSFLVPGNSIISVSGQPEERLPPVYSDGVLDNEFANLMEFGGFGGPPVFMNGDLSDWGKFFPGHVQDDSGPT